MSIKVLMLHGINLNMFGKRDPKQYGTITLAQIDEQLRDFQQQGLTIQGHLQCMVNLRQFAFGKFDVYHHADDLQPGGAPCGVRMHGRHRQRDGQCQQGHQHRGRRDAGGRGQSHRPWHQPVR